MKDSIFKSYDIRGVYNEEFNAEDVKLIARAYLQELVKLTHRRLPEMNILVARDMRQSSGEISETFIREVIRYGVTVADIGLAPIEVLYYILGKHGYHGGVMITASHNPPQYGGLKMLAENVQAIAGLQLKETVKNLAKLDLYEGKVEKLDVWEEYITNVLGYINLGNIKPLKVVIDAGNGMAGLVIEKLFKHLPQLELIPLFFEPNGNFPNHAPNPLAKGAADKLLAKVKEVQADLGAIFDADADRVFLVDETGKFVQGDQTLMLLAEKVLRDNPGAGVVYNVICSQAVPEKIEALGGIALRSQVGWKNIKEKLEGNPRALLGGEVSGHFSFKKNYCSDEAFGAWLLALEIISTKDKKLSELVAANAKYYRGDEINLTVENIPAILSAFREVYKNNLRDELDGLTIEFWQEDGSLDWWFNIRPSNTEPLLRITIETVKVEDFAKRQEEIIKLINQANK